MVATKIKDEMPIWYNDSILPSVMLTFISRKFYTPFLTKETSSFARSRGYKTFFMLNSTEHKISTDLKN